MRGLCQSQGPSPDQGEALRCSEGPCRSVGPSIDLREPSVHLRGPLLICWFPTVGLTLCRFEGSQIGSTVDLRGPYRFEEALK